MGVGEPLQSRQIVVALGKDEGHDELVAFIDGRASCQARDAAGVQLGYEVPYGVDPLLAAHMVEFEFMIAAADLDHALVALEYDMLSDCRCQPLAMGIEDGPYLSNIGG